MKNTPPKAKPDWIYRATLLGFAMMLGCEALLLALAFGKVP